MDTLNNTSSIDIPHAPLAPPSVSPSQTDLYSKQLSLVHRKVMELSWENPSVSFELSDPLDQQLKELLLARGYDVQTYSMTTMVNGSIMSTHRACVSIPNAISAMNRITHATWPVFRFPPPFRYFRGLI